MVRGFLRVIGSQRQKGIRLQVAPHWMQAGIAAVSWGAAGGPAVVICSMAVAGTLVVSGGSAASAGTAAVVSSSATAGATLASGSGIGAGAGAGAGAAGPVSSACNSSVAKV